MNAAIPERRPATEEISGLIERVTYHNDESGFCVLRVKASGQREEMTVVGWLPSVTAGEPLTAKS
jgi:exodeoxyribonuclease V alpha subunit